MLLYVVIAALVVLCIILFISINVACEKADDLTERQSDIRSLLLNVLDGCTVEYGDLKVDWPEEGADDKDAIGIISHVIRNYNKEIKELREEHLALQEECKRLNKQYTESEELRKDAVRHSQHTQSRLDIAVKTSNQLTKTINQFEVAISKKVSDLDRIREWLLQCPMDKEEDDSPNPSPERPQSPLEGLAPSQRVHSGFLRQAMQDHIDRDFLFRPPTSGRWTSSGDSTVREEHSELDKHLDPKPPETTAKYPINMIVYERRKQMQRYRPESDDRYVNKELLITAIHLLCVEAGVDLPVQMRRSLSPVRGACDVHKYIEKHIPMKRLLIAATLIVAEMERWQRKINSDKEKEKEDMFKEAAGGPHFDVQDLPLPLVHKGFTFSKDDLIDPK